MKGDLITWGYVKCGMHIPLFQWQTTVISHYLLKAYSFIKSLLITFLLTGAETLQLEIQNIPSGNYILNITMDNGKNYSEKIIITK